MTTTKKLRKSIVGEESEKCTLHCGDRVFIEDKKVLCSRSLYFNTMFQCGMQESLSNEVTINDVSPEILEFVLHYIDSKKFPPDLDEDLLLETLSASHMLMVDGLTDECSRQVVVTESNYLIILELNEMYRNRILTENTLKFQAKHFRQIRTDLFSRSCDDLKLLLTKTTIEATVDEIIEFLLSWAKTNKEHVQSLSELFSLVDLSSISDQSLNKYLNNEPLISENLDIKNALKEKATVDQLHFLFYNNEEFQTYCVKTKQWSPVHELPKKFDDNILGIFYVKDNYYIIDWIENSVIVIKLSPDLKKIVSEKYLDDIKCYSTIFVINNMFWFVLRSIHIYDPVTEEHRILPNILPEGFIDYEWATILLDESHIFFFSSDNPYSESDRVGDIYYLDFNLELCQWKKVKLPSLPNISNYSVIFGSSGDQLYIFVFDEYIETLVFDKHGEETKEDFLKRIEGRRYKIINSYYSEHYKTFSPDMKIFKFLSDNMWEEILVENFCFCPENPITVYNLMNRKMPFIYFRSFYDILQLDVRNYEWKKILDSINQNYETDFSAFFKKVL